MKLTTNQLKKMADYLNTLKCHGVNIKRYRKYQTAFPIFKKTPPPRVQHELFSPLSESGCVDKIMWSRLKKPEGQVMLKN